VELLLPETCFYVAAGGQVSDTGVIVSVKEPRWEVRVDDTFQPVSGAVLHVGEVVIGSPRVGDEALASIDRLRRQDIMRNHTATHLLHSALHTVLGDHARQAGSLVAPDRLRFDFTHPDAITVDELARIEVDVNRNILDNYELDIEYKPLEQAKKEGAIALFGEKYDEVVRNIRIGGEDPFSNELCGGTHVSQTGDIGTFLIVSEGSAAAGIRRIEAVTGREAYKLIQERFDTVNHIADMLKVSPAQVAEKTQNLLEELHASQKTIAGLRRDIAAASFDHQLEDAPLVAGVPVLTSTLPGADIDTLRQMADRFRARYTTGVAVLAGVKSERPLLIVAVTEDLANRGLNAVELVKHVAEPLGGGGGGRPTLAQAGGKDASKLDQALARAPAWVEQNLKG
jgi:alanyl-tRNA synthetase